MIHLFVGQHRGQHGHGIPGADARQFATGVGLGFLIAIGFEHGDQLGLLLGGGADGQGNRGGEQQRGEGGEVQFE